VAFTITAKNVLLFQWPPHKRQGFLFSVCGIFNSEMTLLRPVAKKPLGVIDTTGDNQEINQKL
jgi:hypothetical protein